MVKTWWADKFFPGLDHFYSGLEKTLGGEFHYALPIYRPFISKEEQNDWMGRSSDEEFMPYINEVSTGTKNLKYIHDPFGGLELKNSGYVDLRSLLHMAKGYFEDKGIIHNELFDYQAMKLSEKGVEYKNWTAENIIFCEGPGVSKNPYWKHLKFNPVKGDVVDIDQTLESNLILNRGVFMIPKNGFSTVGSSYNHKDLTWEPNENDIQSIMDRLSHIFDGKFRILNKRAGVRPATFDRRPFIGFHPKFPNVGIFNGFGTKGVSLAPYFAKKFVEHILGKSSLPPEVSVTR